MDYVESDFSYNNAFPNAPLDPKFWQRIVERYQPTYQFMKAFAPADDPENRRKDLLD